MPFTDILIIILILDIAGIIHILAIKNRWLGVSVIPFSEKLFGKNKTWRGFVIMTLISGILGYPFFGFLFSAALGSVWILGELPNSYIKRRLGIAPGGQARGIYSLLQYTIDTLDSILALVIFLNVFFDFSFTFNVLILAVGFLNHALIDGISYKVGIKKLHFPNPLIIFFQIFVWIVFRIVHIFYGNEKLIEIKTKKGQKNIIIANHISKLDPFILCTAIDMKSTFDLIPYRFMVSTEYTKKPFHNFLLKLVGGYGAYTYDEHGKNQSLTLSRIFLERGETVVIFPEGGIHKKKFGIGAFSLNEREEDSILHLFRIEKNHKKYTIHYKGEDTVRNYPKDMDLLEKGKILFHIIMHHENPQK